MISKFFIERPVLANVLALLMILIGGVALLQLPVAQYPPITPPTVQVTTRYPGAGAQVLVDTVALPIEEQVNGVEGMLYILMVEFARDLRLKQGREILDAAVEAARLRFRPILMTSFAFILGVLPLVFATGAGANAGARSASRSRAACSPRP